MSRKLLILRHAQAGTDVAQARGLIARARHAASLPPLQRATDAFSALLTTSTWNEEDSALRLEYGEALSLLAFSAGRCWDLSRALHAVHQALVVLGDLMAALEPASPAGRRCRLRVAEALNTQGEVLTRRESLAQAEACHQHAHAVLLDLTSGQGLRCAEHDLRAEFARTLVARGNARADRGRLQLAVEDYRAVIDSWGTTFSADDELAARAATSLGNALVLQGRLDDADMSFAFAIERYDRLPAEARESAEGRRAHAVRCRAQARLVAGDMHGALDLATQAADIFGRLCDAAATPTAVHFVVDRVLALSVAGRAHTRVGRLTDAQTLLASASALLPIAAQSLQWPEHVAAAIEVDLGNAFADQGQVEQAHGCYGRARTIYGDLVDAGHRQHLAGLARALTNEGNLRVAEGRPGAAPELLREAERHYDDALAGDEQPVPWVVARAHTVACLGHAEYRAGRLDAAAQACQRSLAQLACMPRTVTVDAAHARTHTLMARIHIGRGELLRAAMCGREADRLYAHLIEMAGARHLQADRAGAAIVIANALAERHEFQPAVAVYEEAIERLRAVIGDGPQHELELARGLTNLGNALRALGSSQRAVQSLQEARQLLEGHAHVELRLAHTLRCLGRAYAALGSDEEARACLLRAIDLLGRLPSTGSSTSDRAMAHADLARLQLRQHNYRAATAGYDAALKCLGQPDGLPPALHVEWAHWQVNRAVCRARDDKIRSIEDEVRDLDGLVAHCRQCADAGLSPMSRPGLRALFELVRLSWGPYARMTGGRAGQWIEAIADLGKDHLDGHRGQLRALEDLVGLLVGAAEAPAESSTHHSAARPEHQRLLLIALDWLAAIIGDGEPAWLASEPAQRRLAGVAEQLRGLSERGKPWLLAEWFLSTHSLRSSRQALRDSGDPEALALTAKMAEFDGVAREVFGRAGARHSEPANPEFWLKPAAVPELETRLVELGHDIQRLRRRVRT